MLRDTLVLQATINRNFNYEVSVQTRTKNYVYINRSLTDKVGILTLLSNDVSILRSIGNKTII